MAVRRALSIPIELPPRFVDLARRRTAFAVDRITNFDAALKDALASAYVQGMRDAVAALTGKEE